MRLQDPNSYGLIVWGTKRGSQIFFTGNIEPNDPDLDGTIHDVRQPLQFSMTGLFFYCIEHKPGYSSLAIYRTIIDAVGRPGFYTVTLIIPSRKTFKQNNVAELLGALSDLYWNRYVLTSPKPFQIDENVSEDRSLFTNLLKGSAYELTDEEEIRQPRGEDRCVMTFSRPEELSYIFEHYRRDELMQYGKIFVLPASQDGIVTSIKNIGLPPVPKKYRVTVVVRDKTEGKALTGVVFIFQRNNQVIDRRTEPTAEIVLKGNLSKGDRLTLTLQKDGYLQEEIREDFILENFLQNPGVSASASIIPGTVIVPLTKKPPPPPPPPPPPRKIVTDGQSGESNQSGSGQSGSGSSGSGQSNQSGSSSTKTVNDLLREKMQRGEREGQQGGALREGENRGAPGRDGKGNGSKNPPEPDNRKYFVIAGIFFLLIIGGGTWFFAGSGTGTKTDSGKTSPTPPAVSDPAFHNPKPLHGGSFSFEKDSTALIDAYEKYNHDEGYKVAPENDQSIFDQTNKIFGTIKKRLDTTFGKAHTTYMDFYVSMQSKLDKLHEDRQISARTLPDPNAVEGDPGTNHNPHPKKPDSVIAKPVNRPHGEPKPETGGGKTNGGTTPGPAGKTPPAKNTPPVAPAVNPANAGTAVDPMDKKILDLLDKALKAPAREDKKKYLRLVDAKAKASKNKDVKRKYDQLNEEIEILDNN